MPASKQVTDDAVAMVQRLFPNAENDVDALLHAARQLVIKARHKMEEEVGTDPKLITGCALVSDSLTYIFSKRRDTQEIWACTREAVKE